MLVLNSPHYQLTYQFYPPQVSGDDDEEEEQVGMGGKVGSDGDESNEEDGDKDKDGAGSELRHKCARAKISGFVLYMLD